MIASNYPQENVYSIQNKAIILIYKFDYHCVQFYYFFNKQRRNPPIVAEIVKTDQTVDENDVDDDDADNEDAEDYEYDSSLVNKLYNMVRKIGSSLEKSAMIGKVKSLKLTKQTITTM